MKINLQLFAEVFGLNIYSNDGLTELYVYPNFLTRSDSFIVTSTGATISEGLGSYTYSGDKIFKGFAISPNSSTVDLPINYSGTIDDLLTLTGGLAVVELYIVETGTTYKHILKDNAKVQVDSAIRDGNGRRIDTNYLLKGSIENYTLSSWTALSSSAPYTYQATVTATATIGNNTIVELINDQPVLFATYGFAIGSVSGQNITIYSIGQPSSSVTLKVKIGGQYGGY